MDPYHHPNLDPHQSPYPSASNSAPFRLDEGFSEETASQDDRSIFAATAARFQEWVMAQDEHARAEIAYEVLRTLRTSNIAAVVERLTPLLHMDPLEKLPPEITSQIFSYLEAGTLLTASLASQTWRARIMDTMLWQELYKGQGWGIDSAEIRAFENAHALWTRRESKRARGKRPGQPQLKKRATSDWLESRGRKTSADVSQWREQHGVVEADTDMQSETDDQEMQDAPISIHNSPQRPNKRHSHDSGDEMDYVPSPSETATDEENPRKPHPPQNDALFKSQLTVHPNSGGGKLSWLHLYKQRQKLEQNWTNGRYATFQLPHPSYPNEAHTECVYTIQFFGKWLVSGSRDKTLRVWDLETRRLRGKPLAGHSQSVLCLQFDPTEKEDVIISGSSDSSVIIWRFSTGQRIGEIPSAHEESVLNLRFDHRYLVTCSKDRRIKIWNRNQLTVTDPDYPRIKRESTARVPNYIINTQEMEPSLLEARMANGTIRALKPYTLLLTLEGHGAAVNAIQINGDLIVSASGDRLIKVWSVKDGRLLRTLQGHQKGIACVQFDSKRIVSGSSDNTVRIYDPFTSAEVAELKGHKNLVRTVQAGFGDLPWSEEEDSARAREVERKYLEDVANGLIVEDRHYSRRIRNGELGSSRVALGSKLPPGGGGSKWGRIVSGSYDETIIIWRKNSQGDWVIGQTLRQEPHAQENANPRARHGQQQVIQNTFPPVPNALAAAPAAAAVPAPTQTPQPNMPVPPTIQGAGGAARPAVVSASQIMQQAMSTSMASLGVGITNAMAIANWRQMPVSARAGTSTSGYVNPTHLSQAAQASISQAVQQAFIAHNNQVPSLNQAQQSHHITANNASSSAATAASTNAAPPQQQQTTQAHSQPTAAAQASNQTEAQNAQAHPPQHQAPPPVIQPLPQQPPAQQTVSRVFKLQFDARRIVCCSQDSRIVGWDFANGDADIIEACRFFTGP
jgi:F-box and WD-40 domain protein 1/11